MATQQNYTNMETIVNKGSVHTADLSDRIRIEQPLLKDRWKQRKLYLQYGWQHWCMYSDCDTKTTKIMPRWVINYHYTLIGQEDNKDVYQLRK